MAAASIQPDTAFREEDRATAYRAVPCSACCSAPQIKVTKSIRSQIAELRRESIDPPVGRHVQMLWRSDYRDKMPETLHR